ncbi:MAG: flagellar biosynthetic protein FliO [Sandaracinaceae bacterium]
MRLALALAGALCALVPSTAEAATVTDAEVELTDEAFILRLTADGDLGEPRVGLSPGFLRVWLPAMAPAYLDRDGDGGTIRFVRVRPGYANTAVTIVRLAVGRRLPDGAVTLRREGPVMTVTVPRRALPGAPAPRPPAAGAEPAAVVAAAAPVGGRDDGVPEGERLVADGTAASLPADGAPPTDAAEAAGAAAPAPGLASPLDAATPALALTRSEEGSSLGIRDGMSGTALLVLLTLALGGAYLLIRVVQRRVTGGAPQPRIEVVAAKRLGTRHQLVVVRALGEDHLLSVQSGRTEKIASVPAPPPVPREPAKDPALLPLLEGGEAGGTVAGDRPRFGAELLRLAGERTRRDRVDVGRRAPGPSDAVSGLLRLRERLGR